MNTGGVSWEVGRPFVAWSGYQAPRKRILSGVRFVGVLFVDKHGLSAGHSERVRLSESWEQFDDGVGGSMETATTRSKDAAEHIFGGNVHRSSFGPTARARESKRRKPLAKPALPGESFRRCLYWHQRWENERSTAKPIAAKIRRRNLFRWDPPLQH